MESTADSSRYDRVAKLFLEAIERDPSEREPLLRDRCGGDDSLCAEVLDLLSRDPGTHGDEQLARPSPLVVNRRIDRYRLVGLLGSGGMGDVYLAEQEEPIRRRVAVKLVRVGMNSREVLARFEAERQALAIMEHPNITRVYDAGSTAEGNPYFVMEHVSGVPLTDHCDRERLGIRERLALFAVVCRAVHHAHTRGVVHRDLKPSNVLVTSIDGKPAPKIIDFGISKAIGLGKGERQRLTGEGDLVGTPGHMAPEQIGTTHGEVSAATDNYALGVLLYELLTGTLPFEAGTGDKLGWASVLRSIQEDDPETPSSRIRTLGAKSTEVAIFRGMRPTALQRALRRELDWILGKALEKEPSRRYGSALAFADDIDRYLERRPVQARGPDLLYRSRKLLARHRIVPIIAASIAVALFSLVKAMRATEFADRVRETAPSAAGLPLTMTEGYQTRTRPPRSAWLVDLDRDAVPELVKEGNAGVHYADVKNWREQSRWERFWSKHEPFVSGFFDLERDGRNEIWVAQSDGNSSWLEVLDSRPGAAGVARAILGPVEGAAHPEDPERGIRPAVAATGVALVDEQPVAFVRVDYDRTPRPREIRAYDCMDGRLLWTRPVPAPIGGDLLVYDGATDDPLLVGSTYSSGNAVTVDSMDCRHAYIFALSGKGSFLWVRRFPGVYTSWRLLRSPWNPTEEVVAARAGNRSEEDKPMGEVLLLDRWSGRTVRAFSSEHLNTSVVAGDIDSDGMAELLVGSVDGGLRVLGEELELINEYHFRVPLAVYGTIPLGERLGRGIVVGANNDLVILDSEMHEMFRRSYDYPVSVQIMDGKTPLLLVTTSDGVHRLCTMTPADAVGGS